MESGTFDIINNTYSGPFGVLPLSRFLSIRGERIMGEALPRNFRRGAPRECFRNAWKLALTHDMEYWEGHAWDPALGCIPFHHAWCRGSSGREVIEPTWHNGANVLYFGVHVPTTVLSQSLEETQTFGILDNVTIFRSAIAARYFMWKATEGYDFPLSTVGGQGESDPKAKANSRNALLIG